MTNDPVTPEEIMNLRRLLFLISLQIFKSKLFDMYFRDLRDYEEKMRDVDPHHSTLYRGIKELMDLFHNHAKSLGISMATFDRIFMDKYTIDSLIYELTRKK